MFKKSFKKMIVGVGAAVMMMSAMAVGANAEGENAIANMHIPASQNNATIYQLDAYFTSKEIPPKDAVKYQNATVTELSDGSIDVTIPMPNTGLSLRSIGSIDEDGVTIKSASIASDTSCDSHVGERYWDVTFNIPESLASDSEISFTLKGCTAHAKATVTIFGQTLSRDLMLTNKDVIVEIER